MICREEGGLNACCLLISGKGEGGPLVSRAGRGNFMQKVFLNVQDRGGRGNAGGGGGGSYHKWAVLDGGRTYGEGRSDGRLLKGRGDLFLDGRGGFRSRAATSLQGHVPVEMGQRSAGIFYIPLLFSNSIYIHAVLLLLLLLTMAIWNTILMVK